MIVNDINLTSTYGVIISSKDIQNSEVINYNDWLDNAIEPIKTKEEKFKFSKIIVTLFVKGISEEEVLTKISNIVALCKDGTLKFTSIDYYFNITLENSTNEKIINKAYLLKLEFKSSYKYKDSIIETMDNISTKVINVSGNTETPAIITMTVPIDMISNTVGINDKSFKINNLKANVPVIINGEDCTVTEAGINKFAESDMWEFPTLWVGQNMIGLKNVNCIITIQYKPKFI